MRSFYRPEERLAGNRIIAAQLHDLAVTLELRQADHLNYRPVLYGPSWLRSASLHRSQRAVGAMEELDPISDADTSDPVHFQEVFTATTWRNPPHMDSLGLLSVAIELDPESPKIWIALGASQLRRGQCSQALESFTLANSFAHNGALRSRALTNCAAALERLRDITSAIRVSYQAIEQPFVSPLAVYNHVKLLRRYGSSENPEYD